MIGGLVARGIKDVEDLQKLSSHPSKNDTSSNDEISSSEDLINYLSARDVEWQLPKNTQEEPPKPHYDPIKTEVEEPLRLDIVYPHSHVASSVMGTNRTGKAHYGLRSLGPLKEEMVHVKKPYNMVKVTNVFPNDDEMFLEIDEVVFKIHTKGYFEYDPLRYVNGSVHCVSSFTRDKDGLKLLHTDNDVHSFIDAAVKNGSINLYVAHKKQNLGKYYYKNMEWEEEDAGLRCSSSTPFSTRVKTKISKRKKTSVIHDEGDDRKKSLVTGGRKGKEKVIEDEGICSKGNKADVTIYKRAMVNGKAKMVEDVGAVKRGKDRGVVIEDGGFINDGGKETVVTKRAIGSRKMEGKSVKSYIMEPIWYLESGCSKSMTGVMSYLQKYVEQPGPKVVFGNNSSGITEGYGLINYGGIVFSKINHALHVKRESIIELLSKQIKISFTSGSACTFSYGPIRPVSPISINHEKYTLVSVNEYSRYTQVHFLKKKSQAVDVIISFIRMVENKNNVKVKQIRTDNGTEFRNYYLESFCPNSSLKFKGTLRPSPAEEKPVLILKSNLNHKLKHVIINNVKICLGIDLEPDELIKDSGYTKHMEGNKNLFSYNRVIEESIEVSGKKNIRNDIEDETLDVDEIVNIKESKNHLLDNVIGNLNK
ncbi:pentatricopeptide repeat-containing protein [Tanacetum coccineum]